MISANGGVSLALRCSPFSRNPFLGHLVLNISEPGGTLGMKPIVCSPRLRRRPFGAYVVQAWDAAS